VADRLARRAAWESLFSPRDIAAAGAAISAAFLFQRSLPIRAAMFLCFCAAAWVSGKKVSPLATILVAAGIVAANLLVPVGRVLAQLGSFRITETALLDGIGKALVFEGLIYVSKASILPGLRLPGRFGSLAAAAFVYYDRIVEYKGSLKPATLIEDTDILMLKIWEEPRAERGEDQAQATTTTTAAIFLGAAVLAAYAPLLITIANRL
jgi:hypothetical protein